MIRREHDPVSGRDRRAQAIRADTFDPLDGRSPPKIMRQNRAKEMPPERPGPGWYEAIGFGDNDVLHASAKRVVPAWQVKGTARRLTGSSKAFSERTARNVVRSGGMPAVRAHDQAGIGLKPGRVTEPLPIHCRTNALGLCLRSAGKIAPRFQLSHENSLPLRRCGNGFRRIAAGGGGKVRRGKLQAALR